MKEMLYANVPHLSSRAIMNELRNEWPWREFCALPADIKNRFSYEQFRTDGRDPGYHPPSGRPGKDRKEYFHFYSTNMAMCRALDLEKSITQEVFCFFAQAGLVFKLGILVAENILTDLAVAMPQHASVLLSPDVRYTLRYVHYLAPDENGIYAGRHYDRGGLSINLYQSEPGFQYLDFNFNWNQLELTDRMIAYGSYQIESLTGGEIQKMEHRVVRDMSSPPAKNRVSAVLFVNLPVPSYDANARSQDERPSYIVGGERRYMAD